MITEGFSTPIVGGDFRVQPVMKTYGIPAANQIHKYIELSLDPHQMVFSPAVYLATLDSGFVTNLGLLIYVSIDSFRLDLIERLLHNKQDAAISLTGDGVGSVRYVSAFGEGGDPDRPLWARQTFRQISFAATFNPQGLAFGLAGELNDFGEAELKRQQDKFGGRQVPLKNLVLRAQLPWALLLVRGMFIKRSADAITEGARAV